MAWRLESLGRSLRELINLVNVIHAKGAGFQSLTEHMDTNTPGGKLVFHFFAALAEFERDIIQERTRAGLAAARGRNGGWPKLEADPAKHKKIEMAQVLHADLHNTIEDICKTLPISRATLYRWVEREKGA